MAELQFFTGTMDSGKSTLALQTHHNHAARGRAGRLFSSRDRAGEATVSSRLGLRHDAVEVTEDLDFWGDVVDTLTRGVRVDFLVCDEAQFYAPAQVDQLARVVDELQVDVFAFGILTDFRTVLFPGSARLVELADRVHVLQVEALCWCGKRATHNARTVDGRMVTEGEVIVVGDVPGDVPSDVPGGVLGAGGRDRDEGNEGDGVPGGRTPPEVGYEVLCRQHHRRRMTASRASAVSMIGEPLPFA